MAKGIRVNQLAKELGVESKAILAKCRDEGLADKVVNHMSMISIGLAETVREWFAGGGGVSTAVETAPPVEVATRPKRPAKKKKTEFDDGAPAGVDTVETIEAPAPLSRLLSRNRCPWLKPQSSRRRRRSLSRFACMSHRLFPLRPRKRLHLRRQRPRRRSSPLQRLLPTLLRPAASRKPQAIPIDPPSRVQPSP